MGAKQTNTNFLHTQRFGKVIQVFPFEASTEASHILAVIGLHVIIHVTIRNKIRTILKRLNSLGPQFGITV